MILSLRSEPRGSRLEVKILSVPISLYLNVQIFINEKILPRFLEQTLNLIK